MKSLDLNNLIKDYLSSMSLSELESKYRIGRHAIRRRLVNAGIQLRSRAEMYRLAGLKQRAVAPDPAIIIERHLAGETVSEIAQSLGISRQVLYARLAEKGMRPLLPGEQWARIRAQIPNFDELARLYESGVSLKQICRDHGLGEKLLGRAFQEHGIRLRSWDEAGRIVWSRMDNEARVKQTEAAHRAMLGSKRSEEAKTKTAATCFRNQCRVRPDEIALREALRTIGYEVSPQLAIGAYNLDIALEEYGVAVEIERSAANFLRGKNRPGDVEERAKYILDQGWSLLFIITGGRPLVFPDIMQKVLSFVELAGRDKPHHGKHGMIRGDAKPRSPGSVNLYRIPRVPGF